MSFYSSTFWYMSKDDIKNIMKGSNFKKSGSL